MLYREIFNLQLGFANEEHLQVLTTNSLQEHWEWQKEWNPVMKTLDTGETDDVHSKPGHHDCFR